MNMHIIVSVMPEILSPRRIDMAIVGHPDGKVVIILRSLIGNEPFLTADYSMRSFSKYRLMITSSSLEGYMYSEVSRVS